MIGDARVAQERLDAEAAMDLSSELQGARSAYFEALEDGEDVICSFTKRFPIKSLLIPFYEVSLFHVCCSEDRVAPFRWRRRSSR
jgi:hypothetical protein